MLENNSYSSQYRMNNSFDKLLQSHTAALKMNSADLVKALKLLSKKKLTDKQKKEIKHIKGSLRYIDKDLDSLGDDYEF